MEALALAEDLYLQKVEVASDCLTVIDMEKPFEGRYSMILREIKSKFLEFNSMVSIHESTFSNSEAHFVAHITVASEIRCQVWLLQLPDGFFISRNIIIEQCKATVPLKNLVCINVAS
jgi:hypothetical protein